LPFITLKKIKMKTVKLISLLIISVVVSLTGCKNKNPKELIVNKWKLKEMIPAPGNPIADSIKAAMLKNSTMEFMSDNKYTLTGMGPTKNGTYSISDDGKLLNINSSATQTTYVDTIIELTKNKLIIVDQMGNKLTSTH
jgi:hypothetical protein